MNPNLQIRKWTILFWLFFLLYGCLEYNITTQVMPDGKIIRTITVKGDSSDIFTGSFRVPSDSSWKISTRLEHRSDKDTDETVYVYEARKEFLNFKDLNQEYVTDSSFNDHINITINLEKTYKWFYIHYVYTETYNMLFPFHSVPVSDYLSETELKIHIAEDKDLYYLPEKDSIFFVTDSSGLPLLAARDSLRFMALRESIEQQFDSWQRINIYNDFFNTLQLALNKPGMDTVAIHSRDDFYQWLDSLKVIENGLEDDQSFLKAAGSYLNTNVLSLYNANANGFDVFKKKFRVAAFSLENYTNNVLMPGKVILSNAIREEEDGVKWTFKTDNFYATDYEMIVESRLFNKWILLGVGGVAVILAVILVLISAFRRK